MDFITASIVGGMLYDILKMGVMDCATCVNVALKDMLLTEEEKALITQDFAQSTEEDRSSKANLENFFETKAPNTKAVLNKNKIQINLTHHGIGDNKNYNTTGNHIENQTINNPAQTIDPKKS
jgi:Het-E N-terminal domain